MKSRYRGVLLTLALTVAAVPAPVAAQPDEAVAEARTRFELAERHFDDGDYALALSEFERVRELMEAADHPNAIYVEYNIALANEEMGREQAALAAYERFLAESGPEAPNREEAQRRLRELRARLELDARDRAAAERAAVESDGSISPIGPIVTAIGGAAMIAGGVLGGVAIAESDRAREGCVDSRCPAGARDGIADAQTLAHVSDALLFGGLAVAATGVVLLFVLREGGDEAAASAACTGRGCAAFVRGRF
ncbi:MAG TPA: tetratricopeptide repeat protein [Sandaracinaceae bacterium LLY-WYZ-13_1]|nr:tetratricopeptide repeat protein [Sandaracinaceae bacterium LLY-WYZ-13_1]